MRAGSRSDGTIAAFPDAFPHFRTAEEYWQNETRDLEELAARLDRGETEVAPGGGREAGTTSETELTNEDFFWDL